jgi:MOSC domain-containing protein YiiM
VENLNQSVSTGKVVAIYIAPSQGEPTMYVDQAHLVPGRGIEGDRYYNPTGTSGINPNPERELTLIEIEVIEAICQEDGIPLTPDQTRRNIITRGIPLNDLVGQVFTIGNIKLRGIRLCEPCNYLAGRTDPRILSSMAHRGGLRAQIISEGFIHLNDAIMFQIKDNL